MGGSDEETLWRRTYGGVEKDKEINKECCSSQRRGKHNPFSNPLVWCGKSRKEHSWGSVRVDYRRPHSGPYNHGGHSSPERGMTAGAQREADKYSGLSILLFSRTGLTMSKSTWKLKARDGLCGSPFQSTDSRVETENVGGQRKNNQSRPLAHCSS